MKRPSLDTLPERFDLVVVGGGITGAGILREAVQTGCKVLLVEQGDFASGTSSRSSKLVHGGLRYLKTGQWRLTLESVRERQRLLEEAPELVTRQKFLLPLYRGRRPGPLSIRLGLRIYDRMAGARTSRWLEPAAAAAEQAGLRTEGLRGAMSYEDAQTDDARLVLRLLLDAIAEGATALNYVRAAELRPGAVVLEDAVTGLRREVQARMVINATGAWAAGLGAGAPPLRPLRGSHLVFPLARLPVRCAVSFFHPQDGRPIFAYPWHGAALYGTTDLDHGEAPLAGPAITPAEVKYLIDGLAFQFPELGLKATDAVSSYSGVRPVVSSGGKLDPSAESREHALWSAPGLVGITGGKLTTFRVTARQALREAAKQVPALAPKADAKVFAPGAAGVAGDAPIGASPFRWSDLERAARHEYVMHLDDLLLRRTRLGLLLPGGGEELLPRLQPLCAQALGWDAGQWQQELQRYRRLWQREHAVPVA